MKQSSTNLLDLICNSELFNVWTLIIIAATIVRGLLAKLQPIIQPHLQLTTKHKCIDLFFDTFQISFCGSGSLSTPNRPSKILTTFLSIFYLLAGLLCSGTFFQEIAAGTYIPEINSIEDLNKTNLPVMIPVGYVNNATINWLIEGYLFFL